MARLALKKAKPNGLHCAPFVSDTITRDTIMRWIAQFPLDELPTVGWSTSRGLKESGINDIAALQQLSKVCL